MKNFYWILSLILALTTSSARAISTADLDVGTDPSNQPNKLFYLGTFEGVTPLEGTLPIVGDASEIYAFGLAMANTSNPWGGFPRIGSGSNSYVVTSYSVNGNSNYGFDSDTPQSPQAKIKKIDLTTGVDDATGYAMPELPREFYNIFSIRIPNNMGTISITGQDDATGMVQAGSRWNINVNATRGTWRGDDGKWARYMTVVPPTPASAATNVSGPLSMIGWGANQLAGGGHDSSSWRNMSWSNIPGETDTAPIPAPYGDKRFLEDNNAPFSLTAPVNLYLQSKTISIKPHYKVYQRNNHPEIGKTTYFYAISDGRTPDTADFNINKGIFVVVGASRVPRIQNVGITINGGALTPASDRKSFSTTVVAGQSFTVSYRATDGANTLRYVSARRDDSVQGSLDSTDWPYFGSNPVFGVMRWNNGSNAWVGGSAAYSNAMTDVPGLNSPTGRFIATSGTSGSRADGTLTTPVVTTTDADVGKTFTFRARIHDMAFDDVTDTAPAQIQVTVVAPAGVAPAIQFNNIVTEDGVNGSPTSPVTISPANSSIYAGDSFQLSFLGSDADSDLTNIVIFNQADGGGTSVVGTTFGPVASRVETTGLFDTAPTSVGSTMTFSASAMDGLGRTSPWANHTVTLVGKPPVMSCQSVIVNGQPKAQVEPNVTEVRVGDVVVVNFRATDINGDMNRMNISKLVPGTSTATNETATRTSGAWTAPSANSVLSNNGTQGADALFASAPITITWAHLGSSFLLTGSARDATAQGSNDVLHYLRVVGGTDRMTVSAQAKVNAVIPAARIWFEDSVITTRAITLER